MKSESFTPDIIISGFLFLIGIVLFAAIQFNQTPDDVIKTIPNISNISIGYTAVLGAVIIGASFFLGVIAKRLVIEVIFLYGKFMNKLSSPPSKKEAIRLLNIADSDKHLFVSTALSGALIIVCALLLSSKDSRCPILTIGLLVETFIVLAMLASWRQGRRYRKFSKDYQNSK
jgi:hypothetical protein